MKFGISIIISLLACRFCSPIVAEGEHFPTESEINYRSRSMAIRFSRDGKRLISAGAITDSKGEPTDKRLRVWNTKTGREIGRLPAQPISPDHWSYLDHDWIGNTLIMPNFDLMLTTWGAYKVKPIHVYSFRFEKPIEISNGVIVSLALSPDEKTLAVGMVGAVQFRDARTFKLLRTYESWEDNMIQFGPDSSTILVNKKISVDVQGAFWTVDPLWLPLVKNSDAFAFSPGGKRLAIAKAQTIEIWTTSTLTNAGRKLKTLKTQLPVVWRLQFSPDGKTLAAGGLSKSLTPVEFLAVPK